MAHPGRWARSSAFAPIGTVSVVEGTPTEPPCQRDEQTLDGSGNTEVDRPLTDYYYAAEQGFPTPGSWPPRS